MPSNIKGVNLQCSSFSRKKYLKKFLTLAKAVLGLTLDVLGLDLHVCGLDLQVIGRDLTDDDTGFAVCGLVHGLRPYDNTSPISITCIFVVVCCLFHSKSLFKSFFKQS